ncbi:MAG: hypothetical protein EGQ41_08710, partial [Clostridiales bacterium]|nr:hypothetical protein [Clostridiales bacterium]
MSAPTSDDSIDAEIAPTEEMQALLTHWYTISEVKPVDANDGITYDSTVYTVCVKLQDEHSDGKLTIGHNVQIGYFAQNQAQMLDEN